MRILLLTQVFPPEVHPTGVMVDQLAGFLAGRGHAVTVAAGLPHHPHGRILGDRASFRRREERNGYAVVRGGHLVLEGRSFLARGAVMATQALGTALAAWREPRADVVLSFGPPLVGPLLAAAVARSHGAALATVIFDLYPDVAIEAGALRNPWLVRLARRAERAVYRTADRVVVLSPGFRRTLAARGVPPERVEVLPVWLDPDEIRPAPRANAFRAAHAIPESAIVVLYAGTIGLVSGAAIMLDVAERLRDEPGALFLFVGEGQVKRDLESGARARGLGNIRFLPFQPREALRDVQATADVSVVTLLPGRGRASVPSKVVGYMAAGRPVVASVDLDSDTAACVRDAACGTVVPPGDAGALADAIQALLRDGAARERMGAAARAAFEREFAAPAVLARYAAVIEGMVRP